MNTVLSNTEIVTSIGLPADIVTKLQTEEGTAFTATANEFITAIVNKICYQKVDTMSFTSPFKKYEGYKINYGDTIENVFVDRALGDKFNKDATNPFEKVGPTVKTLYASINYEMQYPVTIEDSLLRRAALNEYGFMNLISAILKSLVTGRDVDEYLATIIMLNNSDIYANGFEELDVSASNSPAKDITSKLVEVYADFQLPSIDNNKRHVMQVTDKEHCLVIIKQTVLNEINLDYLTGVFNLNKVELMSHIIPVRSFKAVVNTINGGTLTPSATGDDIDFVILDDRGFDIHTALQDGGMIYNPRGKYTNHFTNLWKIIAYRYDYQARAFKIKRT